MSADLLRRAAAKLREHAEGASPAPWFYNSYSAVYSEPKGHVYDDWLDTTGEHSLERYSACPACNGKSCELYTEDYRRDPLVAHVPSHHGDTAIEHAAKDAAYIELLHPPVALALADLLEHIADDVSDESGAPVEGIWRDQHGLGMPRFDWTAAVTLARAVLREETP